jgi:hypothetical protein
MDLSRLKTIYEQQEQAKKQQVDKTEAKMSNLDLQETIVRVVKSLFDYLDGHTSKTVVVNQIKDFATSQDTEKVVSALDSLHTTLKTHENTDISPLTEVMNKVLSEVKSLPKDKLELPEQKFVDYSEAITQLTLAVEAVETAVKSQETTVKAPDVNVEAPVVKVDAPDLKPLEKAFKTAISGIKIPEQKVTDIKPLVDEQKKSNKLLKEIADKPVGGAGGGGGGRATPYEDASGIPAFVTLENGAVPTTSPALSVQIKNDSGDTNIKYIGKALIGSATSAAVWQIQRLDTTSGELVKTWCDGDASFNNVYDNREALSYA